MKHLSIIFVALVFVLHTNCEADDDSTSIQQCTVEILNSKSSVSTSVFEVLYNKQTKKLMLILNKNKYSFKESAGKHELYVLCALNVDIIRLNMKINIYENYSCSMSFDDMFYDAKSLRVDMNNDNSKVVYSVPYEVKDENGGQQSEAPMQQQQQDEYQSASQLTFVEKFILKQDKLNNTIWIYEELPLNTVLGYLQIGTNISALVSVVRTNVNNYAESNAADMTFKLAKLMNDDKNNLYGLTIVKRIDRELIDFYDLQIALKSGNTILQTILLRVCLIDINDNTPIFKTSVNGVYQNASVYRYNLSENHIYYNFAQIYATDSDLGFNGEVDYEIMSIEKHVTNTNVSSFDRVDEPLFRINLNTGYLSLMKKLDREEADFYRLTIRASDKGKPTRKRAIGYIYIDVLDENDNAPKFLHNRTYRFRIRENLPANSFVANTKAFDRDLNSKTEYYFEPKEMSTVFGVDTLTGDLYTKEVIDADKADSLRDHVTNIYSFKIFAKDAERVDLETDSINIDVKIEDLNDNEPVLSLNQTNFILNLTSMAVDRSIVNLSAVDSDFTQLPVNFEVMFIRKLNLNFLYEIVKQQQFTKKVSNNDTAPILEFLGSLKKKLVLNDKYQKVQQNLSSMFVFNGDLNRIEIEKENYNDHLSDGLYNISIRYTDSKIQAEDNEFSKVLSIKVLLFNSTYSPAMNETTGLSGEQFATLLETVDQWHEKYFKEDWAIDYERNFMKSAGVLSEYLTTDNSEYALENTAIAQNSSEFLLNNLNYYRFDYNVFHSGNSIREYYKYYTNKSNFMLNSNLIITLISVFVIISVLLIAIISYKHYKSIHEHDQYSQKDSSSNDTSKASSIDGKTEKKINKKSCLKSFDTNSISLSSPSTANTASSSLYSSATINNTAANNTIENKSSEQVIIDETRLFGNGSKKLPKTQYTYQKPTSKSTTFIPISKIDEEIHLFEIKQQKTTTKTTTTAEPLNDDVDNGYYGSSDYSDNNSSSAKNLDINKVSSPTSLASDSAQSTASSSPSLKPQQQAQAPQSPLILDNLIKTIPSSKADVKIYFERFERIYNSVSQDDDQVRRNSITTCSYV